MKTVKQNALLLLALWITGLLASEAKMPLITRNLEFHAKGPAVFSQKIVKTWGGVIMQAEAAFFTTQGAPIESSKIAVSFDDANSDGFWLKHGNDRAWLEFAADKLLPLLRWIETGATGAYTAYELDEQTLRDAGLTVSAGGHYLPIEFRSTPLEDLLFTADFTDAWDEFADTSELVEKHQKLAEGSMRTEAGDWFVSDVDTNITVRFKNEKLILAGKPHKYEFDYTDGEYVYITSIYSLLDADRIDVLNLDGVFNNIDTPIEERVVEVLQRIKVQLESLRAEAKDAEEAVEVFQVAALLRSIKAKNETEWTRILDAAATKWEKTLAERVQLEAKWQAGAK